VGIALIVVYALSITILTHLQTARCVLGFLDSILASNCCFLGKNTPNICTFTKKRTPGAFRPLRMTDLPSMLDKIDMQRIDPFRRDYLIKDVVGLLSTNSIADQSQAF
jgi:hypothetical protein